MQRVDSHIHLWNLSDPWQTWPTSEEAAIWRDFGVEDFERLAKVHGVDAAVLVQTSESMAETEKFLDIACAHPVIRAVVGWVDFRDPDRAARDVTRLVGLGPLRGLRPMLQSMRDIAWLLDEATDPLISAMLTHGLVFDALILPHQIDMIARFAERHPSLTIVIDHAAKPQIGTDQMGAWSDAIGSLTDLQNVACKLSGLLTEAPAKASVLQFRPVFNKLVETFGFDRMLWGSDWPVVNLAGRYRDWVKLTDALMFGQPLEHWKAVQFETARRVYRIAQDQSAKRNTSPGGIA